MAATSRSSSATALARNSSQLSSSSQNQVYRYPIIYDKLTGATNNQINDVLGAKQPPSDYPIDHYQQQQVGQQQQMQQFNQLPTATAQDDFFANMHRQPVVSVPPGFPAAHQMAPPPPPPPQLNHLRANTIGHHPMQMPDNLMTTQPPASRQPNRLGLRPVPVGLAADQRQSGAGEPQPAADSLPSASNLNKDGARPVQNASAPQHLQQLSQINQQPVYYTPPIFAYNNFDQNRPLGDPQVAGPFSFPHQQQQQQQPPLGVPEQPMSIDEYNARQARLRQLNQQLNQATISNELPQDRYAPGKVGASGNTGALVEQNLLADPQQQQRHKQQMLDRQLLFGAPPPPPLESLGNNNNKTGYYPDPALYRSQMSSGPIGTSIRPPYAHNSELGSDLASLKLGGQAQNRIQPASNHRMEPNGKLLHDGRAPVKGAQNGGPANHLLASAQLPQFSGSSQSASPSPQCALRQQQQQLVGNLEMANSSSQLPVLFCNEDHEYPTKEIMRALEDYAMEKPVEQILPQLLVQLHLAQRGPPNSAEPKQRNNLVLDDIQRQLTLDTLQPSISALRLHQQDDQTNQLTNGYDSNNADRQQQVAPQQLFPSANYEPMCRSSIYMAQPRRAKNLIGQWKVVVNLPGHKYRGTAVSQMVRIEECSRPNSECAAPPGQASILRGQAGAPSLLPKSRCLQHYENQRMVAWSSQQGIHVDIFRVPIACSCHIRR